MKFKIKPEGLLERMALWLNLAPLPLVDTQVAFNAARAIMAAAELGIYGALGKNSKTVEQVIESTHTDFTATKNLLDCLVGVGYLRWKNGNYSIRPRYYKWLLKEYPSNLIGKLRFQLIEWDWMAKLEDYVRTGKPLNFHSSMKSEEWAHYQAGMRDLSVNTARELAGKLKMPKGASHMLDIGGSHGLFSIELCKKNPSLSSTILELPGAIDHASAIAAKENLTERVKYKAGNALTDDLGDQQYDLIMINNVVHHFTPTENFALAKKVAKALKPGGIYAIGEFIRLETPGEGGVVGSTAGLYFSLTSSSGTWSESEMKSWQSEAGLKTTKTIGLMTLPGWKILTAVR
jgi:2-polyprenyl-3-methyl-5-hydroxy-6-metoxy-1,4-benzoquinol methylase